MTSLKRKHICNECELCDLSPRIKKIKLSNKNTHLQQINYNPLSLSKKLLDGPSPTFLAPLVSSSIVNVPSLTVPADSTRINVLSPIINNTPLSSNTIIPYPTVPDSSQNQ